MLPHTVATALLVPPVNLAALALIAVLRGWRRVAVAALTLLLLLALPGVAGLLLASLERGLPAPSGMPPQAIVILAGDVHHIVGPLATEEVGGLTLARLRGGAALARATHLPILVSGGAVGGPDASPLAALMARTLAADFGVPPRWQEPRSRTTWENARLSAAILHQAGIHSIYLVTDAWHMRRALIAFAGTGLLVSPAPLPADPVPRLRIGDFIPVAGAWRESYFALHEWIGCAWYALRQVIG